MSPLKSLFVTASKSDVTTGKTSGGEYYIKASVGNLDERTLKVICFSESDVKKINQARENIDNCKVVKQD